MSPERLVNLASVFNIKTDNFVLSNWVLQYNFDFSKKNWQNDKKYVVDKIK